MKTTTNIYKDERYVRSEKACTLKEYVEMGRLKPGQIIHIVEVKNHDTPDECRTNSETLYVGNCTPFHEPSNDCGEIGWNYDHPRMQKIVLEVFER